MSKEFKARLDQMNRVVSKDDVTTMTLKFKQEWYLLGAFHEGKKKQLDYLHRYFSHALQTITSFTIWFRLVQGLPDSDLGGNAVRVEVTKEQLAYAEQIGNPSAYCAMLLDPSVAPEKPSLRIVTLTLAWLQSKKVSPAEFEQMIQVLCRDSRVLNYLSTFFPHILKNDRDHDTSSSNMHEHV